MESSKSVLIKERIIASIKLICNQEKYVLPCSVGSTLGAGRTTSGQRNSCGKAKSEEPSLHDQCKRWPDHRVGGNIIQLRLQIQEYCMRIQRMCDYRIWPLHPHLSQNRNVGVFLPTSKVTNYPMRKSHSGTSANAKNRLQKLKAPINHFAPHSNLTTSAPGQWETHENLNQSMMAWQISHI